MRATKAIILFFWILIPLAILVLGFANPIVGDVAFVLSLLKLGVELVKFFGNADRWIPGHKAGAEKERRMAHYFYHCERNPESFAKLRAENFSKDDAS